MRKKKETILAAYYRHIRLAMLTSIDSIRFSINKVPGIKLNSVKTPIDLMNEMPALKITKKSFYADAKIKLKARSIFEHVSSKVLLEKQSEFMKQLIEENKEEIRQSVREKLNRFQEYKNDN